MNARYSRSLSDAFANGIRHRFKGRGIFWPGVRIAGVPSIAAVQAGACRDVDLGAARGSARRRA
jgi:hypothetical protein